MSFSRFSVGSLLIVCCVVESLADGKGFRIGGGSAFPISERDQIATIQHSGGEQRMVLAVNLSLSENDDGLWLFPVRGKAEQVSFELLDVLPAHAGEDPRDRAEIWIGDALNELQVWAIPILCPWYGGRVFGGLGKGVEVESAIERWGLRGELLSADSVDGLVEHFRAAGLKTSRDDLASFESYLDGGHSLVAVWITQRGKFNDQFIPASQRARRGRRPRDGERWPAVYVRFPSDSPWFPIRATHGPQSDDRSRMSISVCIDGLYETTAMRSRVGHRYQVGVIKDTPAGWTSRPQYEYTLCSAHPTPAECTEDLVFRPATVRGWRTAKLVMSKAGNAWLLGIAIALLAIYSYVAGGVAGWVVGRNWVGGARLGLHQLGTGLLVVVQLMRKRPAWLKSGRAAVAYAGVFFPLFAGLVLITQRYLPSALLSGA